MMHKKNSLHFNSIQSYSSLLDINNGFKLIVILTVLRTMHVMCMHIYDINKYFTIANNLCCKLVTK